MKDKSEVWLLLSIANNYNQPDAAFEQLFWSKPTREELNEFIYFSEEEYENMYRPNNGCNGDYWLKHFIKDE